MPRPGGPIIKPKEVIEIAGFQAETIVGCPHCGSAYCFHCWECGADVSTAPHSNACETGNRLLRTMGPEGSDESRCIAIMESTLLTNKMRDLRCCIACGGSGRSSRGRECIPCNGTGRKNKERNV